VYDPLENLPPTKGKVPDNLFEQNLDNLRKIEIKGDAFKGKNFLKKEDLAKLSNIHD